MSVARARLASPHHPPSRRAFLRGTVTGATVVATSALWSGLRAEEASTPKSTTSATVALAPEDAARVARIIDRFGPEFGS